MLSVYCCIRTVSCDLGIVEMVIEDIYVKKERMPSHVKKIRKQTYEIEFYLPNDVHFVNDSE
jgi:hypothetical protein